MTELIIGGIVASVILFRGYTCSVEGCGCKK